MRWRGGRFGNRNRYSFANGEWYNFGMEISNLQLTPAQWEAILAQSDAPIYITDQATQKVFMILEKGCFPELEEQYIRDRLEEGFAAIDRGEVEDWDSASIKAEGRKILNQQQIQS